MVGKAINLKAFNKIPLLLILLFFSCKRSNTTSSVQKSEFDSIAIGFWKDDCKEGMGYIDVKSLSDVTAQVNFNLVYLKGKLLKENNSGTYSFFYETSSVNQGAVDLDWMDFEADSSVIKFNFINKKSLNVKWLGFYNKKLKERQWLNSDLQTDLYKCDE